MDQWGLATQIFIVQYAQILLQICSNKGSLVSRGRRKSSCIFIPLLSLCCNIVSPSGVKKWYKRVLVSTGRLFG